MKRRPEQKYIMRSLEPPRKFNCINRKYFDKGFFNWTMGFLDRNDILEPYRRLYIQSSDAKKYRYGLNYWFYPNRVNTEIAM